MTVACPPVTVVGGYLGAGKTTLLNALLENTDGVRIALVVNDFGDVNIDAELIESTGAETIALANGCLCCSLTDNLGQVLTDLRKRAEDLDHIVIEASGVADPVAIGHTADAFGFPFTGAIVLADAGNVRQQARDKYVGDTVVRQLRSADLLVVSKSDQVTPQDLDAVSRWLAELAPGIPTLTSAGRLPASVLLGPRRLDAGPVVADDGVRHARFESWTHRSEEPLARGELEAFLAALPAGVVRVKGLLRLADDPGRWHLLQVVGRRSFLTARESGPDHGVSRIVAIGISGGVEAP